MKLKCESFRLTLKENFKTHFLFLPKGSVMHMVLIKLQNKEHGIGEIPSWLPGVKASFNQEIEMINNAFKLIDREPLNIFDIEAIISSFKRKHVHSFIQCGLDMAMYDYLGKINSKSVSTIINNNIKKRRIKSIKLIDMDSIDGICKKVEKAIRCGFDFLKIKMGSADDLNTIKSVRNIFNGKIIIDFNGYYHNVREAIKIFKSLEKFDIEFIEDPLGGPASLKDYKILKKNISIPLCADRHLNTCDPNKYPSDNLKTLPDFYDIISVKLHVSGGITESLHIIKKAKAMNLKVMISYVTGSVISFTAFAHLASFVDYVHLDGILYAYGCPYKGMYIRKGEIVVPDKPGLGLTRK